MGDMVRRESAVVRFRWRDIGYDSTLRARFDSLYVEA